MCSAVCTNLDVGWVTKVRRTHHLRWNVDVHDILSTCWPLKSSVADIFLAIVGDEVVICAIHFDGDGLQSHKT